MAIKKILVPTDFSTCAGYATDLAVQLAQVNGADVYLYTQIPVHPLWDQLSERAKEERPKDFVKLYELKEKFEQVVARYRGSGVRFLTSHSAGSMIQMAENLVEDEGIDLIVMGSQGASGLKEVLFGSNAQKMVRMAPCPLIVVKKPMEGKLFERLVFASDFEEDAEPAFEQLLQFMEVMPEATLQLLYLRLYPEYVAPSDEVKARMNELVAQAAPRRVSVHVLEDQGLEQGVARFAEHHAADMLVVASKGHAWLYRMLLGSTVESLVNHLDLPILVLTDKNQ